MFKRMLVANRGEIALRIIRACHELGIEAVAIFSEADRGAPYLKLADDAVCVGPPQSAKSYLFMPNIISAAEITRCDAIHPGYGFLAENARFVEISEAHGLTFVGPSRENIRKMGDKALARKTMQDAGVPLIPGSIEPLKSEEEARDLCRKIGTPVILKAASGGGGKGMRVVNDLSEIKNAFDTASAEAQAAFGDGRLYMEKYIEESRHIEFQILADKFGNIVHLGERECSIQRRHQKLIEESPSPAINVELRREMGQTAIRAARHIGYENVGTIEFLLDMEGNYYFIEMNTRLQVEHPVTEMVTGVDIVREQIRVAAAEKLCYRQDELYIRGHSLECRINAEDYTKGFMPSAGTLEVFKTPGGPGIRLDTYITTGYSIPPFYDSMICKLIVWDHSRSEAIVRMTRALKEFYIKGVETTIPFHLKILTNRHFRRGHFSTGFISRVMKV
ncbi:MAG: acetyl-CoA carboxylase biotin carboxylase subunit [bacterium]|jgi:acetyl-CoA carboxylase biotin carboxylase subunit|nr:acetyl-CoA carboxylase biotin carboxylase subunit [bacterium]